MQITFAMMPSPHIRQKQEQADVGQLSTPYIQDIKLEGVIPSPGQKLYLVWNQ
jgi:hypothetical protein